MVEVPGIEPGSEDRQRRASTCLAADFWVRFRPRPSAGLERLLVQYFSPAAAEHQRRTSPLSSSLPPRRRQKRDVTALITQRVPVLCWLLFFPDFYEFPELGMPPWPHDPRRSLSPPLLIEAPFMTRCNR